MSSLKLEPRIVDLLTCDLQRVDPEARETALDRLGVCFGDHVNLIAASLSDPDPEVRTSAAANLGGCVNRTHGHTSCGRCAKSSLMRSGGTSCSRSRDIVSRRSSMSCWRCFGRGSGTTASG